MVRSVVNAHNDEGRKTVSYLCLFIGRGPDSRVLFLVSVRLIMILRPKRKEYSSY